MLLNPLGKTLETISTIKSDLLSLGVVPRNLQLAENLKLMLLSLGLLPITLVLITVNSISSLLSLIVWMWTKLQMLFKHTVTQTLTVQYIVCRWADVVKSIHSMFSKSQNFAWSEVGASRQDYTSASSEMRGVPSINPMGIEADLDPERIHKEAKAQTPLERAMKHPVDIEKLRKAGM
jgi:hypothetical protein